MPRASVLRDEISQLKVDSETKRKPRRQRAKKPSAEIPETPHEPEPDEMPGKDELGELAHKLSDLVENAGEEIRERPVTAVLGALALGVVIGALLKR
ncbi:hypothetical protein [uncultured Roseibium sp.]|uniref:hypothetical protein n=1 Tax=uncultured Roseibium sp. TaxID=1936171 RepID=UPI0026041749|nr:hypothetical protein [uncultured Roseibium sp.]